MKSLLKKIGTKDLVSLGVLSSNINLPEELIDKPWAIENAKCCIFYPEPSSAANLKLLPEYLKDEYPEPKWLEIIKMLDGMNYKEAFIIYTKDVEQLPLFMFLYFRDVIIPTLKSVSSKRRSEFMKYSAMYGKKTNNSEKIPSPEETIAIETMAHGIADAAMSVYNKKVQDLTYTEGFKLELMVCYKKLTGKL